MRKKEGDGQDIPYGKVELESSSWVRGSHGLVLFVDFEGVLTFF